MENTLKLSNITGIQFPCTAYNRSQKRRHSIQVLQTKLEKEKVSMQRKCKHGLVLINNGDPKHFIVCCALCGKSNYNIGTAMTKSSDIIETVQAFEYKGTVLKAPSPGTLLMIITDLYNMKFYEADYYDANKFKVLLGKHRDAALQNKQVSSY